MIVGYDTHGPIKRGMAIVKRDRKYGIADVSGNEIVECRYNRIYSAPKSYYFGWRKGLKDIPYLYIGILDGKKEFILPSADIVFREEDVDSVTVISNEGLAVKKNGKFALYSLKYSYVTHFSFDEIEHLSSRFYRIQKDGKYGVCDLSGKLLIPISYDDINYYEDILFRAYKDGKYGLIDASNEVVEPFIYENIYRYWISKYHTYIILNLTCTQFVIFDSKRHVKSKTYSGQLVQVMMDGNLLWIRNNIGFNGLVGSDGEIITGMFPPDISDRCIYDLIDGLSLVVDCTQYLSRFGMEFWKDICYYCTSKIINDTMLWNFLFQFNLDAIYSFDGNNVARIVKGQKYGLISKQGTILVPPEYDAIFKFRRGEADVYKSGKWGLANDQSGIILPCIFDKRIWHFYGDQAVVCLNGKYGTVNSQMEYPVPCEYEAIGFYRPGFYKVRREGKSGIITRNNKIIVPCLYHGIRPSFARMEGGYTPGDDIRSDETIFAYYNDSKESDYDIYSLNGELLNK